MDFFTFQREEQRDMIWEMLKARDGSLTLIAETKYAESNDKNENLKYLYERYHVNGEKTQFWNCQQCKDKDAIIYAFECAKKSNLETHYKRHHKNKIKASSSIGL